MTLTDSLNEFVRSPLGYVSSALAGVLSLGHLTGVELFGLLTGAAGTWFPALAVSSTTIIPNLEAVLSGDAAAHTMVLVVGGAAYVAILTDRLLQNVVKEWKDRK